jgi:hypothetical protein
LQQGKRHCQVLARSDLGYTERWEDHKYMYSAFLVVRLVMSHYGCPQPHCANVFLARTRHPATNYNDPEAWGWISIALGISAVTCSSPSPVTPSFDFYSICTYLYPPPASIEARRHRFAAFLEISLIGYYDDEIICITEGMPPHTAAF